MFCPECGTQIEDDSMFCEHCGNSIEGETKKETQGQKGKDIHQEVLITEQEFLDGVERTISVRKENKEIDEITLKIPPGMTSGDVFKIPGKGNSGLNGGTEGDLYVKIIHCKEKMKEDLTPLSPKPDNTFKTIPKKNTNPMVIIFCSLLILLFLFIITYTCGGPKSDNPTSSVQTVDSTPPQQTPPTPVPATSPSPSYPNVISVIDVLFEGESLTESGRYSHDQRKELFNQNYKGKIYTVSGKIITVGKAAFTDRKYITIEVKEGHRFDVYPSFDFDLLKYSKGAHVSFIGEWTSLGSGIVFPHEIENAEVH